MTTDDVLDRRDKVLVMPQGQRGTMAHLTLTTDRILFSKQRFMAMPGNGALAAAAASALDKLTAGEVVELLAFADVRSGRRVRRPLRGDVYEYTRTDGTTVAIGASAMKAWDPRVRELLAKSGRRTVQVDDGWQVLEG